MALVSLMRNACRSYKVCPALSVAAKLTPAGGIVAGRMSPLNSSALLTPSSLAGWSCVGSGREISTSPVRLSAGHDHGKLWTLERALSAALLPATPIAILYPSIATDVIMAVSLVMHVHWGVEAIAVDYVRPVIFGTGLAKAALGLVYVVSVATLVGLLNLIFNGPGLSNSLRELWKL